MVLHMLRRLVGDDAFFGGIRRFYETWKFRKAGTDDFRRAMEQSARRDLVRFFETWIFGSEIPHLKFSYQVSGASATVRFDQQADPVDVPVTVTVTYASGITENIVILLAEKQTERTLPLKGPVRNIAANTDSGALVIIDK
jgi:aminopeptidase N